MSGETEDKPSGWTVDTVLSSIQQQHDDLVKFNESRFSMLVASLDERYANQVKAVDAAQMSQQTAMHTAFEAADKAVQAALMSAEKAVIKAEVAANDRFAAVNEFRQTLTDQTATFMPRTEAEARLTSMSEKLDEHVLRADLRLSELDKRLNLEAGQDKGGAAQTAKMYALLGGVGATLGILLSLAALVGVFINRG